MPNWVYITINAHANSKKRMQQFLKDLDIRNDVTQSDKYEGGWSFNFNALVPQPHNIFRESISSKDRETLEKVGIPNWYDWNIENWNTKWNACNCELDDHGKDCTIMFSTAWSFPTPVIAEMYTRYNDIKFTITAHEESNSFNFEMDEDGFISEIIPRYYCNLNNDEIVQVEYSYAKDCWVDDFGNEYESYDDIEYVRI